MTYTIAYNLSEFSTGLYLPSAYIVALDDAKILTYRQKIATADNLKEYQLIFSPTVKKLFDIIAVLSPKNLEKKYNTNPKKILPLINLLTDKLISDKITEFIHRHLGDFLQTIMQEQLPICLDLLGKQIVHLTQLTLNSTLLEPKISFEQTPEGLIYRLRIKENNSTWLIQQKPCLLICNEPAWIIRDAQLYRIDNINSARLKPFMTKDEAFIPQKNVKEYCQKIILPLVEKIDFEHQGFDIIPHNDILKAELTLTHNFLTHTYGILLGFNYGKITFNWKDARQQRSFLDINTDGGTTSRLLREGGLRIHHVKRDAEKELNFINELNKLDLINQESNYFELNNGLNNGLNNAEHIINWLITNKNALESKGFSVNTPVIDNKSIALLRPNLTIKTSQENDWFDIKGDVIIGEFKIPFGQFVANIRDNNPYFLLPNGLYFIMPNEWFDTYKDIVIFGKIHNNAIRINRNQAPQ